MKAKKILLVLLAVLLLATAVLAISSCDEEEHVYGEWTEVVGSDNLNCEERRFYRECLNCGALDWKNGTFDNHSFAHTSLAPNCTEDGYEKDTCTVCGYVKNHQTIEMTGHTEVIDEAVPPTCTEIGLTQGSHCSVCGEVLVEQNIIPSTKHAFDTGYCSVCGAGTEGLRYTLNGNEYAITDYDGTDTVVFIPATYKGLPVTSIGDYAFSDCTSLTSVTIGNGVTSIGDSAFQYCTSLTSIEIPDSVTSIGNSAFYRCTSLVSMTIPDSVKSIDKYAFYDCTSLTSVNIGNGVTSIGSWAFRNCMSLTRVNIPDSITSIGEEAFLGCSTRIYIKYDNAYYLGNDSNPYVALVGIKRDIASCNIHNSTKLIADRAFSYCTSLTSITIPDSVTSISAWAFYRCTSLESIEVSTGNVAYESIDGNLYTKGGTTLVKYAVGKSDASFVIPNSVTSIGKYAFSDCTSLESIMVDESNTTYTSIGGNLYTKDGTTLVQYALGKSDMSFTIPDSVTSIGWYAFYGCTSLTSVIIPESVTSIGEWAFVDCSSLTIYCESQSRPPSWFNIYWNGCPVVWDSNNNDVADDGYVHIVIEGVRYAIKDGNASLASQSSSLKEANIPSEITYCGNTYSVTGIYYAAFENCTSLESVTIPDSVKSISDYAFRGCTSLESVTIPNSVTSIDKYAFSGCSSLTSVNIGNGVTSIGSWAFEDCTSLESITIPNSVTSIGYDAFRGCMSLKSIYISDIANWCNISFDSDFANPLYHSGNLYIIDKIVTELVIPDSVKSISDYAFRGCTSLESVTIPDSVKSIGWYAFYDCTSLTSVTIGNGVTSIGDYAFYGCSSLTIYCELQSEPASGFNVHWNACTVVWDSNNNDVADDGYIYTVVDGIRYGIIGSVATVSRQPRNIKEAIIKSNIVYKSNNYAVTSIDYSAFEDCTSLTSITIPDSVTFIDVNSFSGCSSLKSIIIPESVTSIVGMVFRDCTSLESIEVATGNVAYESIDGNLYTKGGTVLRQYAVGKKDTSFIIPDSVKRIGERAFSGCTSLESVTIPDSVKSIGDYAFLGCTSLESVTIGKGVTNIDFSVFYNCKGLASIYVDANNEHFASICGNLYTIDGKTLIQYAVGKMEKSFAIPDSVTSIGDYAFDGCTSLESVTIPDSVKSIDDYAFRGCTSLTSVNIGNGVTSIGEYAFLDCMSLESVVFGDNSQLVSIGAWAFDDCTSLTSITIPDSVKSIGYRAFYGCTSLASVSVGNGVTSIGNRAFEYCTSLTSITIPDGVTSIGEEAFYGCSTRIYNEYDNAYYLGNDSNPYVALVEGKYSFITSCYIHNSTKLIADNAFSNCSKLTGVIIPDSVTNIGIETFWSCTSLTSVNIGNGVTNIGDYAFRGCTSLENVNIPDSVKSIGYRAFYGCVSLIYNEYDNAYYLGNDSNPYVALVKIKSDSMASCNIHNSTKLITDNAFSNCSKLTGVIIPDSVTRIGYDAFSGCTSLESVTIGKRVTNIGDYAFRGCTSLESVTIPDSVKSIDDYAFRGCTSLTIVNIGNGVTSIGEYAFSNCTSLTSITIPDSVTSIGEEAFYDCTTLTIYCEAENEPSGWDDDWNYSYYGYLPVVWGYKES